MTQTLGDVGQPAMNQQADQVIAAGIAGDDQQQVFHADPSLVETSVKDNRVHRLLPSETKISTLIGYLPYVMLFATSMSGTLCMRAVWREVIENAALSEHGGQHRRPRLGGR